MSYPSRHNLLCSCSHDVSQIIDFIKNIIETCIQKYMSLEETVTYMEDNHKISHHLTKPIWEQLQKESPEFFNKYHLKRELARQITMFNSLLGKQVSLMVEHGALDINTASSDMSEVSLSSLAMLVLDDTNGPTVNRLPIPDGQQNHLHQNQWSTPNNHACTNLGAPTVPPAANDQWFPYSDPACTNLGAPTDAPFNLNPFTLNHLYESLFFFSSIDYDPVYSAVAPVATAQCPTSNDLVPIDTRALTVAKAPTAAFDHFTDEFGDDIENSVPNFQQMDPSTAEQLTQLEHLLDDQYGQYELPLELQTPEYEANNNGLQGVIPQQQRHRYHQEQETNQTQRDPLN
ncbi:uncharacterized protein LOC9310688 [Arabidopsis lyrata subsp. lyrata]|uniref:uncharacterized protein LOC9310688 n=1 Tax=Arabidopsis lyrata subsp. lyrata TaxID=81972 RepID=UPI000A29EAB6|nr:uncharacterized protein LOC9310688 [Arabidopsis lyrata subsp. lyrata]|eukprot:XP_020877168.1 uncharacterized protein LOC9310688 [Arabidopsis lyrata subsp. lyrata]